MNQRHSWLHEAKMASWWLAWEDLEWPDPSLTAKWKERASTFQRQGVTAVVLFGFHFRWDYLPVAERVFGIFKEIADICHDHGLRIVDHHSATLVHRVRSKEDRVSIRKNNHHHVPFYPDSWENLSFKGIPLEQWQQISRRDATPVYVERYNSSAFCPNHPDYQAAYLDYVGQHLEAVAFDALMSDDLHFLPDVYTCGCPHCRSRFQEEEGIELPPASDKGFWENYDDPAFQKWIRARYRWNAEHYQRLRAFLPNEIALWGCASTCFSSSVSQIGFLPQAWIPHCDAVFHEIYYAFDPKTHSREIISGLFSFASLARYYNKPLVALFYARQPGDLEDWLKLLSIVKARPWASKKVRAEAAVPEEILLSSGFDYPDQSASIKPEKRAGLVLSEEVLSSLKPALAQEYVKKFEDTCYQLWQEGFNVDIIFDALWNGASPQYWQKCWVLNFNLLDEERKALLADWSRAGLELQYV